MGFWLGPNDDVGRQSASLKLREPAVSLAKAFSALLQGWLSGKRPAVRRSSSASFLCLDVVTLNPSFLSPRIRGRLWATSHAPGFHASRNKLAWLFRACLLCSQIGACLVWDACQSAMAQVKSLASGSTSPRTARRQRFLTAKACVLRPKPGMAVQIRQQHLADPQARHAARLR